MKQRERMSLAEAAFAGFLAGGFLGFFCGALALFQLIPRGFGFAGSLILRELPADVTQPYWPMLLVVAGANAAFYSVMGATVAAVGARLLQKRRRPEPDVAECPICGYRCVAPTRSACPKCANETSFSSWVGKTKGSTLCRRCRYDLTGNRSGICPECGEPI